MSPHPITHEGIRYRTSEALFQCLRFKDFPRVQEEIRSQASPMAAKMIAKKYRYLLQRQGTQAEALSDLDIMRVCLKLKVEQHPEVRNMLLSTDNRRIIEDSTKRPNSSGLYWGAALVNGTWTGQNMLGQLWMELREILRQEVYEM